MDPNPFQDEAGARRSLFSGSRLLVVAKRLAIGLTWLLLWGPSLVISTGLVEFYYLDPNERDGFAAMIGLLGVPFIGPLGFLVSLLAGWKAGRVWLFLLGAP